MKNRLVVLIGGGGFIGRYAAQALLRSGARVRIAQKDPRLAYRVRTQAALGQSQFVAVDVTRPDSVRRVVDGAHAVVNLVGSFGGDLQEIQAEGAENVARAAAEAGATELVHLSAIGASPDADSVYARTKGEGERRVLAAFPNATVLRPSVVFGREDQFTNRFAAMIARPGPVPMLKPGTRFQPVYVMDVADAIAESLRDPAKAAGQTYELGGPDVFTMAELLHLLAKETGRGHKRFRALPDGLGALITALPFSPISRDQWKLLQHDNVVTATDGLKALGLTPKALQSVAPAWLVRYHKAGRFGLREASQVS